MAAQWWQEAVFYQIYPRSFADSNRDGIGDLDGICAHLDYLNDGTPDSLGVDALWLNPIYPSPLEDWGYDVSDYRGIHPDFGDLASFERMLSEAHRRGIRVILDLVPNHSSDRHPWFIESRASRTSRRRGWYIWAPGAPDRPPNNWLSAFGGPAWAYDAATAEWYLHSFLASQPDLNYRNREVIDAMHGVLRFWFERGVDGFRVDVISYLIKDRMLRDNPPRDPASPGGALLPLYSQDQDEVHEVIRGFRGVCDRFGERIMVGEVWPREQRRLREYLGTDQCQLAFNFRFLLCRFDPAAFRSAIEETESLLGPGAWPTWTLSNHDFPRHVTRYGGEAQARMLAVMMLTLRGTPFIYYGEEIGMPEVAIPAERRRDPVGRDGCRTPMQWTRGGGFSGAPPWLPLGDCESINVEKQRGDPRSMLSLYRRLIRLRKQTPALLHGTYRSEGNAPPDCLVYWREAAQDRVMVALNFSEQTRRIQSPPGTILLSSNPDRAGDSVSDSINLSAHEGIVVEL